MEAIKSPVFPSIPLDIRKELPNPLTPWEVSQELFAGLEHPTPVAKYKMVQVLPDSKEWRFIWRYFHHLKPRKYSIKQVHFIRDRDQQISFEALFSSIETEVTSFPPTWNKEIRAAQRTTVIERWKVSAEIFSPMETKLPDGRIRNWQHTKVVPLWHGTSRDICDSICSNGFVFFGKKIIPGDDGAPPKSTDDGFYGSGLYFTNSARYAADVYSKGHLILGWVSMREPFPVVGDPDQTDMATLRASGAYKNYNAHYIPISPQDPEDPLCSEYRPAQADQPPICDEYVVFQKAQTLPQYWVELEVEPLHHIRVISPRFVTQLITPLMNILQNPQIDDDLKLRNLLNRHLTILLKLPLDEDLSPEQIALYEQITQILTPQGINMPIRNQMVSTAFPKPAQPAQNLPEEEKKEPSHAGGKKHQIKPQPIAKPNAEKMNMLLAVQKDWRELEHASEQLKDDREVVLTAVQQNGLALELASEQLKGDKEIVLAAFHGFELASALQYASKQLKSDREIVLAAVKRNGYALEYACEQLKGDREFVLSAVQKNGLALRYASEQLKADREIVIKAVQQYGRALYSANEEFIGDREIVIKAVQQDGRALEHTSEQLKGDREIVLAAVRQYGPSLKYASEQLKGDREVILTAIQRNGYALKYASKELQADNEIRRAAGL